MNPDVVAGPAPTPNVLKPSNVRMSETMVGWIWSWQMGGPFIVVSSYGGVAAEEGVLMVCVEGLWLLEEDAGEGVEQGVPAGAVEMRWVLPPRRSSSVDARLERSTDSARTEAS